MTATAEIVEAGVSSVPPRQLGDAEETWLLPEQVAYFVDGLTKDYLKQLRDEGKGPRFAKPSPRRVYYNLADVYAWLRASVKTTRDAS